MRKTGLVFLAAALTFSCSLVPSLVAPTPTPTATSTITPSPTPSPTPTATAAPTPLPTIVPPPPPSPGTANVYGRVVWQGLPVEGVRMRLIGPYVWGGRYRERTDSDSDGVFRFPDVPPGEAYELAGIIEDSDLDLPAGSVGASEATFSVVPDSNLDLGSYYLIATDLTLLWPPRRSTLSDLSLSWEPYPGAAYYHVELKQWNGNYADSEIDTPETELELELPLLNCSYGWDVTAYSESGIPLARSDSAFVDDSDDFWQRYDGLFTIHNASLPSCGIALISPADSEVIVGGWNVEFIWEPNPLATGYVGSLTRIRDAAGNMDFELYDFGFVVQEDGSLAGAGLPSLPRGQYNWEIMAWCEDGRSIATSGLRYFTIR